MRRSVRGGETAGRSADRDARGMGGRTLAFFPKIHEIHGQSATSSRPTAALLNGTIPNLKHPGQAVGMLAIRQIEC